MRKFETGATRSGKADKPEYEGYISPLVLRRYGEYMLKHQTQEDGKRRAADNWQKGIPLADYMGSLVRHVIDAWGIHREMWTVSRDGDSLEDLLCAIKFNTDGYLHELLKAKGIVKEALKSAIDEVVDSEKHTCGTCRWRYSLRKDSLAIEVCFACGPDYTKWEPEDNVPNS